MALSTVTPPAELLTANDPVLRQQLRLEADETGNDELLSAICAAARQKAENYTRRRFLTQTLQLRRDGFGPGVIDLGVAPVVSIESIKYLDTAGVWQTVPEASYRLLVSSVPAAVVPEYGRIWPVPRAGGDTVEIRFEAGFGADQSFVPADLVHAVRLLAAHYFENREAANSIGSEEIPMGFRSLLDEWRVWV